LNKEEVNQDMKLQRKFLIALQNWKGNHHHIQQVIFVVKT